MNPRKQVTLRNLTTPELLRYVDRSNKEVAELAKRLEITLSDMQEVAACAYAFPPLDETTSNHLDEIIDIVDVYRRMEKTPTTEANHG